MLLLLACAGHQAPEPAAEATWDVRIVEGPWTDGEHVALAATGPRTLDGKWQGPAIVVAAWVQEGALLSSSSLDSGHGWTPPKVIAQGLEGPLDLELAMGSPALLARRGDQTVLLERGEGDWPERTIGPGPVELAVVDGRAVLARTTPEGLEVDGELVHRAPVCGPAAVRGEDLGVAVAFWERQAEGTVEVRLLAETFDDEGLIVWEDRGLQTSTGRVDCPIDGPAFDGRRLVVSAGGRLFVDGEVVPTEPGWTVLSVDSAAHMLTWTAESGEQHRLLVEGVSLLTSSERRYVPAEPVDVIGELWLPFSGLGATVAAYRPPPVLR